MAETAKHPDDGEIKAQIIADLKAGGQSITPTRVQCKYNIGYARAARLIDELAAEGRLVVQPHYVLPPEAITDDN